MHIFLHNDLITKTCTISNCALEKNLNNVFADNYNSCNYQFRFAGSRNHSLRNRVSVVYDFYCTVRTFSPTPPSRTAPITLLKYSTAVVRAVMLNLIVFGACSLECTGARAQHSKPFKRIFAYVRTRARPLQSCTSTCGPQASIYSPRARARAPSLSLCL